MTHTHDDTTTRDTTHSIDRERAMEALAEALAVDDPDEKDYHVREALQLLAPAAE